MKLSPKQKQLLNVLDEKWIDVMEFDKLHLNTVYSLCDKGLIEIKWIGNNSDRKMMIRKKIND